MSFLSGVYISGRAGQNPRFGVGAPPPNRTRCGGSSPIPAGTSAPLARGSIILSLFQLLRVLLCAVKTVFKCFIVAQMKGGVVLRFPFTSQVHYVMLGIQSLLFP